MFDVCGHHTLSKTASEIPVGQKDLPDAELLPAEHGMGSVVPKIEVAHQADRMGTWCPYCETSSPESSLGLDESGEQQITAGFLQFDSSLD